MSPRPKRPLTSRFGSNVCEQQQIKLLLFSSVSQTPFPLRSLFSFLVLQLLLLLSQRLVQLLRSETLRPFSAPWTDGDQLLDAPFTPHLPSFCGQTWTSFTVWGQMSPLRGTERLNRIKLNAEGGNNPGFLCSGLNNPVWSRWI